MCDTLYLPLTDPGSNYTFRLTGVLSNSNTSVPEGAFSIDVSGATIDGNYSATTIYTSFGNGALSQAFDLTTGRIGDLTQTNVTLSTGASVGRRKILQVSQGRCSALSRASATISRGSSQR